MSGTTAKPVQGSRKSNNQPKPKGNAKKNTGKNSSGNPKKNGAWDKFLSRVKGEKLPKKALTMQRVGLVLTAIEIIAAISLIVFLFILNMIPVRYMMLFIVVVLLISAYIFLSQLTKAHWLGKVLAVFLSIVMIAADIYIAQAIGAIGSIAGTKTKTDIISVYVLKDDAAESIEDAKEYTFARHAILDKSNTDDTVDKINTRIGQDISTKNYTDLTTMVTALYQQEVGALIINESYVETLEEIYPNFETETKVIYNETFSTEMQEAAEKNVTKDTFTIYLSGNDSWGQLTQTGRSDVNILLVVNPKTRQILMVNTPRDYYVEVDSLTSGIGMDKLTHAAQFGVDASMATLSALYDNWEVDYYVKLNFSGVEGIVDALGGITVNSEVSFTTHQDTSEIPYTFYVGENYMNGNQALAFCRERQNIAGGDNQRGRDQMAVINAIINKVTSPSILASYSSVLETVSGLFATSLSDSEISSLVRMMLDNPTGWEIQSYAVSGTGDNGPSHFFGYSSMYIMVPDTDTVQLAIDMMNKVKNGETFNVDAYVESQTQTSTTE